MNGEWEWIGSVNRIEQVNTVVTIVELSSKMQGACHEKSTLAPSSMENNDEVL